MQVVGVWACKECGFEANLSYEDLADVGNPICPDCDCEMELLRVE
jgi:ABC-type ATPase with predicted acetyltransferase domain